MSTMKTIYLHIGSHKTGSTALQSFCALNLELLKQYGVDYLIQDTIWNGHHCLGWAFRGNNVAIEQYCGHKDNGILNHLKNSIEKSDCETFLLSSENFFLIQDETFVQQFFETFKSYDIKVIVYLREQSDFLESWYYELVRADYCCLTEEFEEYLEHPQYDVDYFKILTKWMRYVDKDNIKVIPYDEIKRNRSLYTSFLNSIGIFDASEFKLPKSTNERVSYSQLLEIRDINKKGLDLDVRNELVRDVIKNKKLHMSKNISLFSDSIKSNTKSKYFSSNVKLYNMFGVRLFDGKVNDCVNKNMNLIVHAGMGKTGSSSIQKSLVMNNELLNNQGVKYVGLLLENANLKKFDWQSPDELGALFANDEDYLNDSIYEILLNEIYDCKQKNINTIIWSNESLLRRFNVISKALLKLQEEDNVTIKIVLYLREPVSWILSSYKQWGIKHKQYSGKLQKFEDWDYWLKQPRYYEILKPILDKFKDELIVRNMSSKRDVVKDFFNICSINMTGLKFYRGNDSPSNEELFFRALFNNNFNSPVLPKSFDHIIGKTVNFKTTIQRYMSRLLPTSDQLKQLSSSIDKDRTMINEVLKSQNEVTFDETNCDINIDIDLEKIAFSISELTIEHSLQIDEIKKQLNSLSAKTVNNNKNNHAFDDSEINLIRDVALMIEEKDIQKAYGLMSIALKLRPEGPYIAKKLEEYKRKLK